jgi:hypothetical protein
LIPPSIIKLGEAAKRRKRRRIDCERGEAPNQSEKMEAKSNCIIWGRGVIEAMMNWLLICWLNA